MTRRWLVWACGLAMTGCGASDGFSGAGHGGDAADGDADPDGEAAAADLGDASGPTGGQLTAGDWDDNRNFVWFETFKSAFLSMHTQAPRWNSRDRIGIRVEDESGQGVGNARVTIAGPSGTLLEAPTGSDGRLLYFPEHDGESTTEGVRVTIAPPPGSGGRTIEVDAPDLQAWTFTLPGVTAAPARNLDLAFVVDATGSMGDELGYLSAEIDSIASSIQNDAESIRYALVVYRDHSDDFVTRTFDFTDSLEELRIHLTQQAAQGGGDLPEAATEAMHEMNGLSWRDDAVRVAFHVADAPPHPETAASLLTEIDVARQRGIRIYPVAASGVEDNAEYLMRIAAQVTGARYVFLTDDSGIGLSHAEPHIPCYEVEYLNAMLTRAIQSELVGHRLDAAPTEILRTVGSPQRGVCIVGDEELYL